MELYEEYKDKLWEIEHARYFNRIMKIEDNCITFEKSKGCGSISTQQLYHIEFVENRVPIRLCHEILNSMNSLRLDEFFRGFNVKSLRNQEQKFKDLNNNPSKAHAKIEIKSWCNENVGRNREQQKAVENIVNCSSFPLPYVIFGPPGKLDFNIRFFLCDSWDPRNFYVKNIPELLQIISKSSSNLKFSGTGKTSTLVEAVAQIIKLKPNAHVLVTANSNSACDEIGIRLLNYVSRHEIFRFYSPSFERPEKIDRLHPVLKPLSNFKTCLNQFPTYEEIYFYKIVVCSLVSYSKFCSVPLMLIL